MGVYVLVVACILQFMTTTLTSNKINRPNTLTSRHSFRSVRKRTVVRMRVTSYSHDEGPIGGGNKTMIGTSAISYGIAADTRYYPAGTVMYIPGYGYGKVDDCGSAIKGPNHIDARFPNNGERRAWDTRYLNVEVFK